MEGSSVRCVKDSPRLQVGDGPLDGGPQRADDTVGVFLGCGEFCPCRFPVGCEKSKPEMVRVCFWSASGFSDTEAYSWGIFSMAEPVNVFV